MFNDYDYESAWIGEEPELINVDEWEPDYGDPSDEDFDEYPGDCDDWDIEMGFDPYEGCYTYDC